ncbi:hypothetical protein N7326_08425 [Corynebacterium sp. ES2794-CONJ1]|uniref:hypothetical protein n=1 Tax=unclassified Corynebacterium TaxID=2624378 RepID=UPI00216A0313|nr:MULTISPECIES: hypothetical protein [unclassified Corynebacterium]MCS4490537.1 hypothetical protein [Corynebacterium sp. ES2775-CONJ]MCS4492316.1 hypothetical protein [Corynebacterium sp. ES2715-CONJ3]MCS4532492.1 hypothetical protein [Corynebacterium sp. ES2730-CONJ]MCU9519887.1 hypothetical protein [Corynebacterium sp. ES2794-CONJ1]
MRCVAESTRTASDITAARSTVLALSREVAAIVVHLDASSWAFSGVYALGEVIQWVRASEIMVRYCSDEIVPRKISPQETPRRIEPRNQQP